MTIEQVLLAALQANKEGTRYSTSRSIQEVIRAAERAAQGVNTYGIARWRAHDILNNFRCTPEQAEAWLAEEDFDLRDHQVEAGWEYIYEFCDFPRRT